jgi:3-dehydroquinate synthase
MKFIKQDFIVPFSYYTYFTEGLFKPDNLLFKDLIEADGEKGKRKLLVVIDSGVNDKHPQLQQEIFDYVQQFPHVFELVTAPVVVPGGEPSKNDESLVHYLLKEVEEYGICRHSYMVVIGGGAVLDMAGYVAAIAHRGVRLIRIPTTVLSQNDSGVGVKNGINAFEKKNFIGTFRPPYAVINDMEFLTTLRMRDWRAGIAEAIKVALIKDKKFFDLIRKNVTLLVNRDKEMMQKLIYRCADLKHIAGGDPFENGSSRPLDFGHWSAHKLESLTAYKLRHGEAVAIGMALDVTYSYLVGLLPENEWEKILDLIQNLGFKIYVPQLDETFDAQSSNTVLSGLNEFREHLGGELTIMLIESIGKGIEVNHIDISVMKEAIDILKEREEVKLMV